MKRLERGLSRQDLVSVRRRDEDEKKGTLRGCAKSRVSKKSVKTYDFRTKVTGDS